MVNPKHNALSGDRLLKREIDRVVYDMTIGRGACPSDRPDAEEVTRVYATLGIDRSDTVTKLITQAWARCHQGFHQP